MTAPLAITLIAAPGLLFVTVDDDLPAFWCLGLIRSLFGRRTVGLFIRPQNCINPVGPKYTAKSLLFRAILCFPDLIIATIIPFEIAPSYSRVARLGLADPQLWDAPEYSSLRETELSAAVKAAAGGRQICIHLGVQDIDKGLDSLADTLLAYGDVSRDVLIVCAGAVTSSARGSINKISTYGGLVIDRYLTAEEIFSLYIIADKVWACYEPSRDQASGVFGRAIQLGIPVIVRAGSVVQSIACHLGAAYIDVDHRNLVSVASALVSAAPSDGKGRKRPIKLDKWKQEFLDSVKTAMAPRR